MLSYALCAALIIPTVDLKDDTMPWWKGSAQFGVQLHYGVGSASMESANAGVTNLFAGNSAQPFGLAHSVEVSLVFVSPWHARLQAGAAGLYDWATFPHQGVDVTGHAWAVVVPILLGYRLPLLDDKIAVSFDAGVEIQPVGGYGFTSDPVDSPTIITDGTSVGWTVRAGAAWHIVPQFAITAEIIGRGLKTNEVILEASPNTHVADNLDFSGVGVRTGITGYFF